MVICFRCDARTKDVLDQLLESGSYRDHSEVIVAAVASYAALHAELEEKPVLVIDRAPAMGSTTTALNRDEPTTRIAASAQPTVTPYVSVPSLFQTPSALTHRTDAFAPVPSDVFAKAQQVPLDRWIFGQYSKVLPIKASVRALANLKDFGQLDTFASRIASSAAGLSGFLRSVDARRGLQRDDALAVGFPSEDEKSRLRYANQYVGSVSKQGIVSGALIDFKLINTTTARNGRPAVGLTRHGWEFAMLESPVLDTADPHGEKFSAAERDFLLEHIVQFVPAEAFAYRAIITAVMQGATTPDALDEAVRAYVPDAKKETISKPFITTQRSGVVSRMSDLGLLSRIRDGVRVSYEITEAGRAFVERIAA